jgi:phage shock protein E
MPISGVELVMKVRATVTCLTPEEAAQRLAETPDSLLLDIREAEERGAGNLEAATHVPRGLLEFKIADLCADPDHPIVIHCASGGRAVLAARAMLDLGYTNVHAVLGPFADFARALDGTD